jgi:DNA helicase HerA-like ATPase
MQLISFVPMKTREADIPKLKSLSEADAIDFLIRRPEDQWLERVSARTQARTLADLIAGFANAEGGLLVGGGPRRQG